MEIGFTDMSAITFEDHDVRKLSGKWEELREINQDCGSVNCSNNCTNFSSEAMVTISEA